MYGTRLIIVVCSFYAASFGQHHSYLILLMFSVASPLWANAAFALISAPLTFLLVYQYFLPYNPTNAPQRPKTLYWLLIATVSSLFVACVLNVVYHAQQIPTTDGGPSLHIHNLVLGGWITLMVFASISRTIPLTLLLFAFAVLLLSRWNVLANQFSRTKDSAKSPYPESSELPFLGWKWKKAAVYMTTTALVVLPIASNLSLSIGIATHTTVSSQDGTFKNTVASLSRSVQRLVLAWDGINAAFVAIAIIDIGISTLLLSRKLRSSRYVDPVRKNWSPCVKSAHDFNR